MKTLILAVLVMFTACIDEGGETYPEWSFARRAEGCKEAYRYEKCWLCPVNEIVCWDGHTYEAGDFDGGNHE